MRRDGARDPRDQREPLEPMDAALLSLSAELEAGGARARARSAVPTEAFARKLRARLVQPIRPGHGSERDGVSDR